MNDLLRELSALAEDSVSDIQLIVLDHRAAHTVASRATKVGRFGGPATVFGDRATQLAVANIVGTVEHYAEHILLEAGCSPNRIKNWDGRLTEWGSSQMRV